MADDETQQPTESVFPVVTKRWTVTMKDGTVYQGVEAPTADAARQKMLVNPQGPLAPVPQRTPRGSMNWTGLPEAATGVGALAAGPAMGAATLASEAATNPPGGGMAGRDVAGSLIPAVVGALLPQGRTVGRFLGTLGANVAGRGAVEAGAEALSPTGEGPLAAGIMGAAKGVLPGLAQGAVGAALGPGKDTLMVQRAAKALQTELTPELARLIDPSKPAQLLSKNTVKVLQNAAGARLDKMEAEVEKALGPTFRFQSGQTGQGPLYTPQGTPIKGGLPPELMARVTGQPPGKTFGEVRAQIKELRDIGERQYAAAEMRDTARAAINDARKLEQTLLQQMPPEIATKYRDALVLHAKDSGAIRWLKGVQAEQSLLGGANPQDRPGLAQAERAISGGGGRLKGALHGALGAAEALTGRPIGAGYHLGRAADVMRSQGPLRPAQGVSQVVPRISGGIAGMGTSLGQRKLLPKEPAE